MKTLKLVLIASILSSTSVMASNQKDKLSDLAHCEKTQHELTKEEQIKKQEKETFNRMFFKNMSSREGGRG